MFDLEKKYKRICFALILAIGGILTGNVGVALYGAQSAVESSMEAMNDSRAETELSVEGASR